MKIKVFSGPAIDLFRLEKEINEFLESLPDDAVKHVTTAMAATRTQDTDQQDTECVITVWYSDDHGEPMPVA